MRAILLTLAFVAVTLAGCADEAEPEADPVAIDTDSFVLEAGKGAIAGLLVDDRFRPLQLTDDPQTEFQTTGFILLQETGEQLQTTQNGEFSFLDLKPGQYTLRVTAAGHEATPQRVQVKEAIFNEVSLIARRVASLDSAILTQDYSLFIPCSIRTIENGRTMNCIMDQSGDSWRSSFETDYSTFGKTAAYLVTEMVPNQQGGYRVQVRAEDYPDYSGYYRYGTENNYDTDYIRIDNPYGVVMEEDNFYGDNKPWENDAPFNTVLFPLGQFEQEVLDNWPENPAFNPCCGLGFRMGIQGKFIQSVFLGVPAVDPLSYCALC